MVAREEWAARASNNSADARILWDKKHTKNHTKLAVVQLEVLVGTF